MLRFGCEGTMSHIIPEYIIDKYGYTEETVFGDEFLVLKATFEKEIVAALERHGYTCEENLDLVSRALGG